MDSDPILQAKKEQPAAVTVTLASMEATKESVRRVQPDTSRTQKASRFAKNVQSIRIFLNKASHPKQIVKNVPTTNQQVLQKETRTLPLVFVQEHCSTRMPQQMNVKFAQMVPIVLITTA